jgi:uncharacterized membrane protein
MNPFSADAIAALHPQIVHFTIALAIMGVALRLVSLIGRPAFASPAATLLLVLAAIASVVSAQSGTAAHGPVERMPGVRSAVVEHEEWGERARNVLIIVGTVELVGILLTRWSKVRMVQAASAVLGLVAVFCVYEAAEHGGELVYGYAGGVGIRSGDPKDVERLLLAGLYQQALADRTAGRAEDAGELVALAGKRFAGEVEVRLLAAESLLIDKKDAQAAIQALAAIDVGPDNRILRTRRATLQADAFEAAGQRDAAIAVLKPIVEAFPTNTRLKQRLESLMGQ